MANYEEFQHGFYGASGVGAGMHLNKASDFIDAEWANRVERAMETVYGLFQSEGHYGPFRMETVSGVLTERFVGDGVTSSFTLNRAMYKHQIYGYDIYLDDPYANGILPTGLGGVLSSFGTSTSLSNTLLFTTAPATGESISVKYYHYSKLPSQMNSASYLQDWQ